MVAARQGADGHYIAGLTFPSSGSWTWTIHAFTMNQPMPALQVLEAQPALQTRPEAGRTFLLLAGGFGLALIALAGVEKTYQTGVKLTKEAMQAVERQVRRWPTLQKWFVDIPPEPIT